jgi:plastocyanin
MGRPPPIVALVAVLAVLAALGAAGCNADGKGSPGPGDLDIDLVVGARVEVGDDGIRPAEVTVTAGEMVEFTNGGDEEHRLVAEDTLFDSGDMRPGETFLFLFEEPGRVDYRDRRDPDGDGGTVIVAEPSTRAP